MKSQIDNPEYLELLLICLRNYLEINIEEVHIVTYEEFILEPKSTDDSEIPILLCYCKKQEDAYRHIMRPLFICGIDTLPSAEPIIILLPEDDLPNSFDISTTIIRKTTFPIPIHKTYLLIPDLIFTLHC